MAAPPLSLLLLLSVWAALLSPALSLTCASQKFTADRVFGRCIDLPQHDAYLHWTYDAANSSLSVAYVAAPPSSAGWVAWAINPTATGMIGAQALIAFQDTAGGGAMTVKTYNVESYRAIKESKLSFEVWDLAAESVGGSTRIFAKVKLPEKKTTVNQVWQVGPSVSDGVPGRHSFGPAYLSSKGTLDLAAGQATTTSTEGDSRIQQRNIHGMLNGISWGVMFPIGVIIARYLRVFPSADPLWFYLHVSCQMIAYIVGVAGWGLGMKLGNESQGIQHPLHRNLGIALFCLATLQVCALIYRPHKGDKLRFYWEIYHHCAGYTIVGMGIVNVLKGMEILNPAEKWHTAYVVILLVLVGIAILLEGITWTVVSRKKSAEVLNKPYDQTTELPLKTR